MIISKLVNRITKIFSNDPTKHVPCLNCYNACNCARPKCQNELAPDEYHSQLNPPFGLAAKACYHQDAAKPAQYEDASTSQTPLDSCPKPGNAAGRLPERNPSHSVTGGSSKHKAPNKNSKNSIIELYKFRIGRPISRCGLCSKHKGNCTCRPLPRFPLRAGPKSSTGLNFKLSSGGARMSSSLVKRNMSSSHKEDRCYSPKKGKKSTGGGIKRRSGVSTGSLDKPALQRNVPQSRSMSSRSSSKRGKSRTGIKETRSCSTPRRACGKCKPNVSCPSVGHGPMLAKKKSKCKTPPSKFPKKKPSKPGCKKKPACGVQCKKKPTCPKPACSKKPTCPEKPKCKKKKKKAPCGKRKPKCPPKKKSPASIKSVKSEGNSLRIEISVSKDAGKCGPYPKPKPPDPCKPKPKCKVKSKSHKCKPKRTKPKSKSRSKSKKKSRSCSKPKTKKVAKKKSSMCKAKKKPTTYKKFPFDRKYMGKMYPLCKKGVLGTRRSRSKKKANRPKKGSSKRRASKQCSLKSLKDKGGSKKKSRSKSGSSKTLSPIKKICGSSKRPSKKKRKNKRPRQKICTSKKGGSAKMRRSSKKRKGGKKGGGGKTCSGGRSSTKAAFDGKYEGKAYTLSTSQESKKSCVRKSIRKRKPKPCYPTKTRKIVPKPKLKLSAPARSENIKTLHTSSRSAEMTEDGKLLFNQKYYGKVQRLSTDFQKRHYRTTNFRPSSGSIETTSGAKTTSGTNLEPSAEKNVGTIRRSESTCSSFSKFNDAEFHPRSQSNYRPVPIFDGFPTRRRHQNCMTCEELCAKCKNSVCEETLIVEDILCKIQNIFREAGKYELQAIEEYYEDYRNKEYFVYGPYSFADMMVFLQEDRGPQPSCLPQELCE